MGSDDISITSGKPTDIPAMVAVLEKFMRSDPYWLALSSKEPSDTFFERQSELNQISLDYDLNRRTDEVHVLVARDAQTREVLGFCDISAGQVNPDKESSPGQRRRGFLPFGSATNELYHASLDQDYELHCKHVPDPHLVCVSLYVLPKYRGQGIGTRLLVHALTQLGLENRTIYLQTPDAARSIFTNLGWREVDTIVVDLAEWAGKYKGYGLHRRCFLVREPRKLIAGVAEGRQDKYVCLLR